MSKQHTQYEVTRLMDALAVLDKERYNNIINQFYSVAKAQLNNAMNPDALELEGGEAITL